MFTDKKITEIIGEIFMFFLKLYREVHFHG